MGAPDLDSPDDARRTLYAGLYDGPEDERRASRVRVLNPGCGDEDATSRRFSLLEVD